MHKYIICLALIMLLLLSACLSAPGSVTNVDIGDPICLSGTGQVQFQLRSDLYKMTPEGPLPTACEVRTFVCEESRLGQQGRELLSTPCN